VVTDEEMTRLLAEKVMGWHLSEEPCCRGWRDSVGFLVALAKDGSEPGEDRWNPLERIEDAWEVQEAMLIGPKAVPYFNAMHGIPWTGWYGNAATVAHAICLAALRAVGEEV
jgi:hypothetical protein